MSMFTRTFLVLSLSVALAACGGRQRSSDLLTDARAAVDGAADAERCAEAEYRAAVRLMEQAEQAYADREYDNARQLAEAARAQAERAREIAAANDDCDRQSDNQQAVATVLDPTPGREAQEYTGDYVFSTVYFGFDSSSVSTEAGSTLQAHARYLQENPSVRLRLEGHCDDAGTSEYNFALGQRRAAVVRQFLMELGISGERLSTLSYGEEMPDRSGNHDRNRRVEFVASE
ncbi:MAG: OmpA family protein [Myxococcales bacterium]|nr:OmpA family protein [Myxococcales bacterium]